MTDKGKSLPRHLDKQDNYHTQTHVQTQMQARRLTCSHSKAHCALEGHVDMCASLYMHMYSLSHSRSTYSARLLNEGPLDGWVCVAVLKS